MEKISIIAQFKKRKPTSLYGTIYIRGYYCRKPVKAKSTGYTIHQDHWDADERKVRPGAPNASLINSNLSMQLQEMQKLLLQKQIMGVALSRVQVSQAIRGIDDSRDFIKWCKDRIAADYGNEETRRTYESECNKLEAFRAPISFADINFEFLTAYKNHLRDKKKNSSNTIWRSFKFINTMIIKAEKTKGIINENPFKEFDRGKYIEPPKGGITIQQCEKIEKICEDPDKPILLRRIAMYFLLMAYSGMRFSDAMSFNPVIDIRDGRFVKQYQKFNTNVNFETWDRLEKIIDLIKINPLKRSNQEFNRWLKIIASMAGITSTLTTHIGRHTMGGFLADMDVPIEKAQIIMGHKDIESTRVYYHIKNKSLDQQVSKLNEMKSPNVETSGLNQN